ncbi:Zinc finger, CCHC-type [Lasallia pustulata]|uniref:Zinc finger, CCHC-type n=1 Tax=Lasallia pustulata TaxID=136370 RepID=A0A1W5D9A7_9LECA|nr:Zinc finger, CCHC-type [Lasallia pustulata]
MATSISRGNAPDFALCGSFTGKTGQSATRWLKKVEWELEKHAGDNGSVDPSRFLRAVDLLLADNAAAWAETTPGIVELLEHPAPNADTVAQFKGLFNQQYPLKVPEPSVVHFDSEISDLRQKDDEALVTYYQRTTSLLSRVGGRDRPREITPSTPALSPLEAAMLDTVMRAFTRGIRDSDIRRDALRGLVLWDRSLCGVYSISEESRRAKGEYIHLQEEAAKAQELQFYREVVQRNMPTTQINSLKASFHVQYMPQWGYPSQPSSQWSTPAPTPALTPHHQPALSYAPHPFQPQPVATPYQPRVPYQLRVPNQPATILSTRSSNPYINGTMIFSPGSGVTVCIRCGEEGHISINCFNPGLSQNEQSILRSLVLGDRTRPTPGPSTAGPPTLATTDSNPTPVLQPAPPALPAVSVQSITYGMADLGVLGIKSSQKGNGSPGTSRNVNSTEVLLGEGSGRNKRAHVETPALVTQPVVPPARPGTAAGQGFAFQGMPDPQGGVERPKKKGQKRTGKAATINPLVELINEDTGFVDKPTSVRQLLRSQKVDMTWMDFCVWSPTVCREIKRLLTRMSNRRKKGESPAAGMQSQTQQGDVSSIAVDGNTRFLSTLMGADKAFRIPYSVRVKGGGELALDRSQVQADQGSDMNVISTAMAKQLGLHLYPLSDVGFAGLTMKTADHRETLLYHWVYLDLGVEDIWRQIHCFVAPELPFPVPGVEHLSLLLGIPWLYSVNATTGIRGSRIEIGDPAAGETSETLAILTARDSPSGSEQEEESETDSAESLSEEEEEEEEPPKEKGKAKKGFW